MSRPVVEMTGIEKFDCNNTKVPASVLNIIKSLKSELVMVEDVESVVLFGSYSKGTYTRNSDVDIAVFARETAGRTFVEVFRELQRCAANYMLDIQILLFSTSLLDSPMGIIEEIVTYGRDITAI